LKIKQSADLSGYGEKGKTMATMVKNMDGKEVYWDAAVALMDDDIREQLHEEMAPCTDQEFFTAYEKAHKEKFGEEFIVN
jgi:hypothetical protein